MLPETERTDVGLTTRSFLGRYFAKPMAHRALSDSAMAASCSMWLVQTGMARMGGGRQRIGVATGPSLEALTLNPNYLLEGTPDTRDERSVFPNGALLLENGTVVLTYMGQAQNDSWGGIFLATSDCSVGCPWRKHGVVIGCGGDAAHTSGADPQASKHSSG